MNVGYFLIVFGVFGIGIFLGSELQRAANQAIAEDAKRRQARGMDIVKRTHLEDHKRGYSVN